MWPHPNPEQTAVIKGLNGLSVYHNVDTVIVSNDPLPPTAKHSVVIAGRRTEITAEGTAVWGFDDRLYTATYDNQQLQLELHNREKQIHNNEQ
jgi:hypothetical protein